MGIEEDSLQQLKQLNTNILALTRAMGKMPGSTSFGQNSNSSNSQDGDRPTTKPKKNTQRYAQAEKAATNYEKSMGRLLRASGNLTNEMTDVNDDLKTLRESWNDGAEAMLDMSEDITKFGMKAEALRNRTVAVVAGMSRFQSKMAQNAKAQSLLHTAQLGMIEDFKTFEKAAYFDELSKSVGSLSKAAKARLKLVDAATGQMRSDLNVDDFKRARATIGELEASFKEVLSGTDFKSFSELLRTGQFNAAPSGDRDATDATRDAIGQDQSSVNRDALVRMAAILQERGMFKPSDARTNVIDPTTKKIRSDLENIDFESLASQVAATERSFERAAQNIDRNVNEFSDSTTRFIRGLQNQEGRLTAFDTLKRLAGDFLSLGSALKFAKDKIIKAWDEISDFNIAQIPASYWEVNKASISLGLSFKETVKLMDENKRLLAIYGPDQFKSSMNDMQKTFQKYGYTFKQAAEMIGPTVESAIASGINIRDPGELNKYTDNMMGQFQKLSGMTKITAQEFAALNRDLFKSEGTFETMLGMDVQRRQAYAQELVQMRTKYVAQGLEIRQAQELVAAQQAQQRGRLKDRGEDAAKLLTSAQLAGLGNEQAMEAYRLASKGRRTEEEQVRLSELAGQINQGLERRINDGYGETGSGAMGDILNDARLDLQTSGAMTQMTKGGSQIQMAKEAGAQVTPEEQKAASTAAKGNESVAVLGQAINQVSSVINNAFLGAIVGSTAALVALGLSAARVSAVMGGPGGILNAIRGGAGAAGGAIRGAAGAAGGAIRGAAGAAGGAVRGAAGAAGGLLSSAGGAVRGAAGAAGSIISSNAGILGKAAGALGGAILAFQAWGEVNEAEEQRKKGEITDKQATVKKAGAVGGAAGGIGAGMIGAAVGQVLIPIPGVGAVVGGAVGAALGGWLGKSGSEAVADAIVKDKKPEAKTAEAKPAKTEVKPAVKTDSSQMIGELMKQGKTLEEATKIRDSFLASQVEQADKNRAKTILAEKNGVVQPPVPGKEVKAQTSQMVGELMKQGKSLEEATKIRDSMLAQSPPKDAMASITPAYAKPLVSGIPMAPPMPKIGVDSVTDTTKSGINTATQDEPTVLDVKDTDALLQLQTIAQNMAQAVIFLQQLAEKAGVPGQNTASTSAPSPNNMNQIPSAFQFTTGRRTT